MQGTNVQGANRNYLVFVSTSPICLSDHASCLPFFFSYATERRGIWLQAGQLNRVVLSTPRMSTRLSLDRLISTAQECPSFTIFSWTALASILARAYAKVTASKAPQLWFCRAACHLLRLILHLISTSPRQKMPFPLRCKSIIYLGTY